MQQVSLLIPFYNESAKFERFRTIMLEYLSANQLVGELILVDDGSTDDTQKLLQAFKAEVSIPVKTISVHPNKGKGNAIKAGIAEANQAWVLCNDADFSYLPQQLDEWVSEGWLHLQEPNQAHFGSRELGAQNGWVQFKWHRRIIGRIYAWLIRLVTGISVTDTQCGFKLYPTDLAKDIFAKVQEERFAFDVEVHYILRKMERSPKMLPVKCIEFGDSKVHLLKDSLQMGRALWHIRKHHS
jgi:glycosyltransferase involved in cell wall biosynthesis